VSTFTTALNLANTAFGVIAGETFEVALPKGNAAALGNPGTYSAINIDDVEYSQRATPGGTAADVTVDIYVKTTVIATAGIVEGTKLVVRGKRMRVIAIVDEGDDTKILKTGPII
jgi:hypothetical protein